MISSTRRQKETLLANPVARKEWHHCLGKRSSRGRRAGRLE